MAETNIKTIQLDLPFVKVGSNELPDDPGLYGEPGCYFVEMPSGNFSLAEVQVKDSTPLFFELPISANLKISRFLAEQKRQEQESAVLKLLDELMHMVDSRTNTLNDTVDDFIKAQKEANYHFSSVYNDNLSCVKALEDNVSKIRTIVEALEESKKNTPEGGFVTEKILLDIISSVRK